MKNPFNYCDARNNKAPILILSYVSFDGILMLLDVRVCVYVAPTRKRPADLVCGVTRTDEAMNAAVGVFFPARGFLFGNKSKIIIPLPH